MDFVLGGGCHPTSNFSILYLKKKESDIEIKFIHMIQKNEFEVYNFLPVDVQRKI
jgi:hypothetical protein